MVLSLGPAMSQRVRRPPALPSAISEDALRAHIKFLSDDRLEGRGTGSKAAKRPRSISPNNLKRWA